LSQWLVGAPPLYAERLGDDFRERAKVHVPGHAVPKQKTLEKEGKK
jgi:hypothetical protein